MRFARAWLIRLAGVFGGARADREFDAELDSHLQLHIDDNIRAGMTPHDARRRAVMALGGIARTTEEHRDRRRLPLVDAIVQDTRYAIRGVRRNPGFAAACIVTLALGIGINSAIFSVVNGVLFSPLPYSRPDRLISIWTRHPEVQRELSALSSANALDLRSSLKTATGLEALQANIIPATLRVNGEAVAAQGVLMTPGMFALLGQEPLIGRTFRGDDGLEVMVLSHAFWTRQFGADPSVIGRQVGDGRRPVTVIGVMPRAFTFPYASMLRATVSFTSSAEVDFWVALPPPAPVPPGEADTARTARLFAAVARLKDGVSVQQAQTDLDVAWRQLAQAYPNANAGWEAVAIPLHEQAVAPVRSALLLLLGGVGVVLMIACVNVANLLLARGVARQRDLALRAALGASRGRLLQQVIIESLVLSLGGAAAGLVFARWATPFLVSWAPPGTPRLQEVTTDWTVVLFAAAVAVVCGLAAGLAPGLGAARASAVRTVIDEGGRGATDGRRRLRGGLVAAEVALAVVLTIGAGLLVRSFVSVLQVDPGFRSDHLLTMSSSVPGRYDTPARRVDFYQQLFARLDAIPGVESSGGTTRLPLGGANSSTEVAVEGRIPPEGQWPQADLRRAVHNYFQAMGIPLERGRWFDARDHAGAPPVVVINETFERQLFGDVDPIGRQIRLGPSSPVRQATIVGVIGDLRHHRLDLAPAAEVYVNYMQAPPVFPLLVLRTAGDPLALVPAVRAAAREVDAAFSPFNFRTMADLRSTSMLDRRFVMSLVSSFGVLAVLLAGVGVYGVMTLVVAERTREMGIRLALGAPPAGLMRLVMRQALVLAVIGGGVGLGAALMLAPLLANQLYGVGSWDPLTMAAVCATLVAVAVLASVLPARRVLRVDPMTALRND